MEQIVEQLKARREHNRKMLDICVVALGIRYEEEVMAQVKAFSLEAQACNEALRALLGDYWEIMEEEGA